MHEFIEINRYTGIQGNLYNAESGEYAKVGEEPLFRKFVLRGEKMDDGRIADTNYVWLASWFRTNYEHHYLRTIDYAFHQRLRKPIAKALYPLLATGWYASGGRPFEKRYSAICQRFLLQQHPQASLIKRQLGPALQELQGTEDKIKYARSKRPRDQQREQYLEKWQLRRSADGKDWILTFFPGTKYFEDLDAARDRQKLAKRLPKALSPATRKRASSANPPDDFAFFFEEIGRILPVLHLPDEAERKKVTALCRKWLQFYPFYGVIDQALSEYKHDTEDLPLDKQVETPLAYFQRILHRIAHTQGYPWIKPKPRECDGCAQHPNVS
ncbi:MAG: hypothetical protein M3297_15380 [Thermoproteota archaeon]|nr:hypothetical protein [Thermoproteota archaeon]